MMWTKTYRCAMTAAAFWLIAGAAQKARADSIQTFTAQGTFVDGATLSGTVTIDTALGTATSADLIVSAPDSLTFVDVVFQAYQGPGEYVIRFTTTPANDFPYLDLWLPVSGLVGYDGGSLGSTSEPVGGEFSNVKVPAEINLTVGSLSAAPEPSSLVIAGTAALAGLGLYWRRRGR